MSIENERALTQSSSFLDKVYNRHLIPTMLMSIGVTLNVFFDGVIVGQTLGADSFAAVNLCMPIYLFLCTVGSLIGSGGFILSSHAMGIGDTKKSSRIFNTVVVCMLAVSVLLTIMGLFALRRITTFLAGGSELYQDVYAYTLITIAGALPKLFLYLPLFYLRLDGKSKWASTVTIVMTGSNILLDLLFVCVFDMGTGGAAFASVLATLLACVVGVYALSKTEHFCFSFDFEKIEIFSGVFRYGSPAAINNLMSALRVLTINAILLSAGGSIYVSVFSVLNNINEISLFIVDGVPQTAAPIIGMYCAERSNEGIRILMKHQLKIGLTFAIIFGICISVFADFLGQIFGVTYEMRMPVMCLALSILFVLLSRIMISYYNASGNNILSSILTAVRLVIFPALVLQIILQANGMVWMFLPIAEAGTIIFLVVVLLVIHILNKNRTMLLLLDERNKVMGNVLEFSVASEPADICSASEKISDFCVGNDVPQKKIMRVSLAIEELLTLMCKKCFDKAENESFDLRVFASDDEIGIRIRSLGKRFNPLCDLDPENEFEEGIGIRMLENMTEDIAYSYVLGTNNLLIRI